MCLSFLGIAGAGGQGRGRGRPCPHAASAGTLKPSRSAADEAGEEARGAVPDRCAMQFSSKDKALFVKIVYYGPGLSGKTTNLESIHRLTDPARNRPLVSLKTDGDRTLFFDLLPFDLGKMFGMNIRIKLYTVPGQIQYDTTRKQVLAGADGVVFVADSSPDRKEHNVRMIRYLRSNLKSNGLDADTIPLVFQWNKRDVSGAMDPAELSRSLDWRQLPALEAVATDGRGVIETFREITVMTIESLAAKAASLGHEIDTKELRERVRKQLDPFIPDFSTAARDEDSAPRTIGTVHSQDDALASAGDGRHREALGLDALLQEAVQANLTMSEELAGRPDPDLVQAKARRERQALTRLVQIALVAGGADPIFKIALSAAVSGLDAPIGSILLGDERGRPLKEVAVAGRSQDPLNSIVVEGIGSAAAGLLDRGEPFICHDIPGELLFGRGDAAVAGLRSMLAVPCGREAGLLGLLLVYSLSDGRDLGPDDVAFASLVGSITGLALRAAAVPA